MKRLRAFAASPAIAGVFICAALLLSGCASPQVSRLSQDWPANLPAQADLGNTPFFAQAEYECGPAALAMAISEPAMADSRSVARRSSDSSCA